MAVAKPFEILVLPKKNLSSGSNQYRVYKADGKMVEVTAGTVQEALKESGDGEVIKVERALLSTMRVLEAKSLEQTKTEEAPVVEKEEEPPPAEAVAATEAEGTAEQPTA